MVETQLLSDQRLIDSISTYYGIKITSITRLALGADIHATVYKARTQDSQNSYFVKLKRGHHHDIGAEILELLHNAGITQIILPIKTKKGLLLQLIGEFTLMVFPYVEGQNGFDRNLTDYQWKMLGAALKQLHKIDVPSTLKQRLRKETFSAQWREAVRSLYYYIESNDVIDDPVAIQMQKLMMQHQTLIYQLVDNAEQLSQSIQHGQLPEFVLCHCDIHAGNVLLQEDSTIYIVDWDEPILAPKERDLMFIGAGVGNVWNKPQEEKSFYDSYGEVKIHKPLLAYYRIERIVEDIAQYGQQLLLPPTTDSSYKDRMESYHHFNAQFAPNGVVEIALKTYF